MATGGPDRMSVNCGLKLSGKYFVLNYKLGKTVKDMKAVSWDWELDSSMDQYVAKLEAKTESGDIKYHTSAPIDSAIHAKLGKPDKSLDDGYYTVKLKKLSSDVPDLEQFFNVTQ